MLIINIYVQNNNKRLNQKNRFFSFGSKVRTRMPRERQRERETKRTKVLNKKQNINDIFMLVIKCFVSDTKQK